MNSLRFFSLIGMVLAATLAFAQPKEENPVTLVVAPMDTVFAGAGDTVIAYVPLKVTPGFHVNANPAASEDYIPLEVTLDSSETAQALAPRYPKGRAFRLEGTKEDLLVYDGEVVVEVPLVVDVNAKAGVYSIKGRVEFQACDGRVCFFPEERPLRVTVFVQ